MLMEQQLNGMTVAILVSNDFEQIELTSPRDALHQAGARTMIISNKPGQVVGMNHDEKADSFPVDAVLGEVNPMDFDAVLLPGGALNADFLRVVPEAQEFVRRINAEGRPMAVICHAPWLLVSAGLVSGRTLTSYHTIRDDIRNAGGIWRDHELVRDGNWVTSRSPKDLPAFNSGMVDLFAESLSRQQGRTRRAA
jgi:protease I